MFGKFFNRFGKNDSNNSKPDPSLGYPRLPEFRRYLTRRKYAAFEKEYEALPWDARTLIVEGIGLEATCAPLVQQWVAAAPGSAFANLFAGVSKTCLAWVARTGAVAAEVSDDRTNTFFDLLNEAYSYLRTSDELNPADPETCARMVRVLMGLGSDEEVVRSYFTAATDLVPNHVMAHLMMLNYLTPKWHGTVEKMDHFAFRRYIETGTGILVVLPLIALTEEQVYYGLMNEEEKDQTFFADESRKSYFLQLYNAYHEEADGALFIPYVYNYFAYLAHRFGEHDIAKKMVRKINGQITFYPWAYLGINDNKAVQALYP